MNKSYTFRSENPYAICTEMQAAIRDEQVTLTLEGGGTFYIDSVEDATWLRDALNLWIAYQEL